MPARKQPQSVFPHFALRWVNQRLTRTIQLSSICRGNIHIALIRVKCLSVLLAAAVVVLTMKSEHWIPTLASIERSGGGGWTGRVFVRGCSRDHSRPISGEWKISSPSSLQSTFLYPIFLTHFHQHFPQSFNLNIKIFRPSHISWIYTARIKRSGKSALHLFWL